MAKNLKCGLRPRLLFLSFPCADTQGLARQEPLPKRFANHLLTVVRRNLGNNRVTLNQLSVIRDVL